MTDSEFEDSLRRDIAQFNVRYGACCEVAVSEEKEIHEHWFDDGDVRASAAGVHGTARIAREGSDEVFIDVQSDGPGWLLLLDNWYPGWRADVNGVRTPIRRADYTFRAVAVPAGKSTVRFTYVPLSFWIGLSVAILSALALAAACLRYP